MLNSWAFIYLSPGFSPEKNSFTTKVENCKFQVIGLDINKKEEVIKIVQELVKQGVQTIELCGGFGPAWVTKISESINYQIPIGSVMYGPEFRKPLFEIMNFKK